MPFGRQGRPGLLGAVVPTADPSVTGQAQGPTAEASRRAHDRSRESAAATGPPRPHAGADQLADQLARLAQLHSSGVLTPEEFAAAKSRLLA
ncbi:MULTISPECIES: SHOCT domain-containing protein [unclassified Arthrobacter]|uniref:SHOCT domain-containing protein n=1 Tax=unclassified Arthrobacter TaxID=235627 RepID=UPI0014920C6F|nr:MULTISPECIES: SHOCT domain-containing protein [unclassified Arthrobacter]MBE0010397.1 SHOCT domain-containing protein [Arthrobacter sp. AET 35A]NOJ59133.1 SHOCT domain-containing protein [Arthrobacter sp. 260]NOJ64280.1 SHOCT domain-containing protein [Arthrobacter sp. 147(2020)]